MFCAYTRPRNQVSINRTIGPLVALLCFSEEVAFYQGQDKEKNIILATFRKLVIFYILRIITLIIVF